MKRSLTYSLITLIGLSVTGCGLIRPLPASLCQSLSSEELGRRDGALGDSRTRVKEREEECKYEGVPFDPQAYHQGEKEALNEYYCTPLHAVTIGEMGGAYHGVCDRRSEERFLKYMKIGAQMTNLRIALHNISLQLDMIQAGDVNQILPSTPMSPQQQSALISERTEQLKARQHLAYAELSSLEARVARLRRADALSKEAVPSVVNIYNPRTVLDRNDQNTHGYIYPSEHHDNNSDPTDLTDNAPSIMGTLPSENAVYSHPTSPEDQPPYTQMAISYDDTLAKLQNQGPYDPTRPDYGAHEYEDTARENALREGRRFAKPDEDVDVVNKGTTLFIEKDWYPR